MINFRVVGPFKLVKQSNGQYGFGGKRDPEAFLAERLANGCYVFATQQAGKYEPWYVARTARVFWTEVLATHRQKVLAQIQALVTDPKLFLFLIVLDEEPNRATHKALQELKQTLVKSFRARNPALLNQEKETAGAWEIGKVTEGEQDAPGSAAATFRSLF